MTSPTSESTAAAVAPPELQTMAPASSVLTGALADAQRRLAVSGILIAAMALLAVVLLWQKVVGMQEQLAQQSAHAQSQSVEALALSKQAVALAQETSTRVAVVDTRLSEVALQRSQLDELMQSMSRSRDENLVVDIEAALRLAQQQAQLTGSIEPLLAALKSADQRIVRAAQPRLGLLQRAIARDIDRVRSATVSDTPNLLIKFDELVLLSDELALANAVAKVAPKPIKKSTEQPLAWWDSALQLIWYEVQGLVRVSRIDHPEAVLLSPEQGFFIRENLKLKFLNARLGLLARQTDAARTDLEDAERMLRKYFDVNARKTQAALGLLQQVRPQMRALQMPRLDDTMAVLATAAAGR